MNTGIIMIGMALVLLSVGLLSSPASATVQEHAFGQSCCHGIVPYDPLAGMNSADASGMTGVLSPGTTMDKPVSVP